jgi:hypothetical protein
VLHSNADRVYSVKQLRSFFQLTYQDQKLLLQAFIILTICRARLRVQNIKKLQSWATRAGNGTIAADHLVWVFEIASRRLPGATCLCRALALQRMLAANGQCSELRIGVEKTGGVFAAHAWLVRGDRVMIGGEQLGKYNLLAAWRSRSGHRS